MALLTLPRELVEHILLLLATESVQTCRLVNKTLNQLIQSSGLLQYFQACDVAGVIDNPRSSLCYAERLEALKKREDAWRSLKPVFEMTISVKHQTASSISRSIEGVYFLSDENLKDLNYCHLTSLLEDNPQWIKSPGHGPSLNWSGILVNFVTALYEHDLLVSLISFDTGNQADTQRHSLDLVLLKFSTGEYHPLARRSRIHVQRSSEVRPWVVSRIVGDNLALVVHSDDGTFSDKLFIFDWKTGRKLLQHEATENAYSGLVFVSPELLLVPNCVLAHFEVWYLPPNQLHPKPPIQILSLQLPAISPQYLIFEFGCYGEPNPFLHAMSYFPPRPFFTSPENSIIMVTLGMVSHSSRDESYNLIMHRRALLDMIQTWGSPALLEQQEYIPTWLTKEVTVHQTADPSVELDEHSILVSTIDSPTYATSQTSRSTIFQVPWEKWGPPISRWFKVNDTHAQWISHSNGQRCAFSEPNPLDRSKLIVSVADFNLHNFRKNAKMMARLRNGDGENNGNNEEWKEEEEEKEFEMLDHEGVFSEDVGMGLKCVVYRMPDEYDFDLVLIDEQRLLGLKVNHSGCPESIKILDIG